MDISAFTKLVYDLLPDFAPASPNWHMNSGYYWRVPSGRLKLENVREHGASTGVLMLELDPSGGNPEIFWHYRGTRNWGGHAASELNHQEANRVASLVRQAHSRFPVNPRLHSPSDLRQLDERQRLGNRLPFGGRKL